MQIPTAPLYPSAAQPVHSAVRTTLCALALRLGGTWVVWASLAVAVLAVTGCATAEIPHMAIHPESSQKRVRAVHHWDVLARDVAQQVASKTAHWPAQEHPIFVQVQGQSGFEQGFAQLLMTQLVDKGINLSTTPVPVTLNVMVQVVQHPSGAHPHSAARWLVAHDVAVARGWASADRVAAHAAPAAHAALASTANTATSDTTGMSTAVAVGGAAPAQGVAAPAAAPMGMTTVTPVDLTANNTHPTQVPPVPAMNPRSTTERPVVYGDPKAWMGPEMSSDGLVYTEVLVTTSLESGGRYLARSSDVYYINAQDAVLYGAPVLPPPPPPVKGKTWQVVAP